MDAVNDESLRLFLEGRGLTGSTEKNYRVVLSYLDRFFHGKDFRTVTEDDMRRFMKSLHVKASTRNLKIVMLKNYFRWLHGFRRYMYPSCVD